MGEQEFSVHHIVAFKKMPFWLLFKSFRKKPVEVRKFRKVDDDVVMVIKSYWSDLKGFKLDPKVVDIHNSDVSLIFGIQPGRKKIDM
ncbi:hypothetical protein LOK49_LG03G02769 [Camellia lanceoleosa]|uniref:Uncharacterized protein n=1 Tax=Camellia lanceoleosa TaxID=1840588 RepID=A0ACC0IEF0_9ERIC|nr:hypothetical protein LOK49_LG03G02769 [Camellia lanceoleosa]